VLTPDDGGGDGAGVAICTGWLRIGTPPVDFCMPLAAAGTMPPVESRGGWSGIGGGSEQLSGSSWITGCGSSYKRYWDGVSGQVCVVWMHTYRARVHIRALENLSTVTESVCID